MEPKIIFEDQDLLVLDKPAGMTVNKSETTRRERTVQDWLEKKLKIKNEKSKIEKLDFYIRSGIVHRIDKETSGLLIVAKTPEAFENLQQQFKARDVKKTYIALVHRKVAPEEGEISVPVGRLSWNRKRFGVVIGGRESMTKYKVIANYQPTINNEQLTLLELYPQTGRTHQIRVHLKYAGHPIFGDPLYAGRKTARADRKILPRVFLHAAKISFTHPTTGRQLSLDCPLPQELQKLLKS